jgi:hypothetical protein
MLLLWQVLDYRSTNYINVSPPFPIRATFPTHHILLYLTILIILRKEYSYEPPHYEEWRLLECYALWLL